MIKSIFSVFVVISIIYYTIKRYGKKNIPENETLAEKQQREYSEGFSHQNLDMSGVAGQFDRDYSRYFITMTESRRAAYAGRYKQTSYFVSKEFWDSQDAGAKQLLEIIEAAYKTIGPAYEQSMKTHVLDLEYTPIKAKNDFCQAVYHEILQQALGSQMQDKEKQINRILEKNRLQAGKIGSAYILLRTLGNRVQASADDLKTAKTLDAEASVHSQRCYYIAMHEACIAMTDVNTKSLATHYWHARILVDLMPTDYHVGKFTALGAFSTEQAQVLLQKRLEGYEAIQKYEPMIRTYNKTGQITEKPIESYEQLNIMMNGIDVLMLFEIKPIIQSLLY